MKTKKFPWLAGIVGNAIEWYDFAAYAAFAPVIAAVFFPQDDPKVAMLLTYGVFAIGFLGRPLGALALGYLGDRRGRRFALLISIILITIPTLLLGLLPSYAAWGIAAPLALTLLRFIQGMAISGELTTAATYLVEHAGHTRRGFAGSLAMARATFGIVVSTLFASIITAVFSAEEVARFGWRVAFLFGALLGLVGLFLRLRSHETSLFSSVQQEQVALTLWKHCQNLHGKQILLSIVLTTAMSVGNYCVIAFFATFLTLYVQLSFNSVLWITTANLAFMTVLLPVMGRLSDSFGRKPLLLLGLVGSLIAVFPVFYLLTLGSVFSALCGLILFSLFLTPITALIPTTLAELFHVRARNLSLSLGYNVSLALFGGTSPLICMALIDVTHVLYAPAMYFAFCLLVSLAAWWYLQENFQRPLR